MNAIQSFLHPTDLAAIRGLVTGLKGCKPGADWYAPRRLPRGVAPVQPDRMMRRQASGNRCSPSAPLNVKKISTVQHAPLCCCALDALLAAQQQAKQALDRTTHRAMGRSTIQPKEDPNHGKS